MMIMNNLSNDNKGIQYEAFLLLGVVMKNLGKATSEDIKKIIVKNQSNLMKFVKEFKKEEETEYTYIRDMILHQLKGLEWSYRIKKHLKQKSK